MKDILSNLVLKYLSKAQIIGFVAGIVFSLLAGTLGMTATDIKKSVCDAPVIQLPK